MQHIMHVYKGDGLFVFSHTFWDFKSFSNCFQRLTFQLDWKNQLKIETHDMVFKIKRTHTYNNFFFYH